MLLKVLQVTEERSDIMCKVGDVVRYGSDDGIFEGIVIKITGLILTVKSGGIIIYKKLIDMFIFIEGFRVLYFI